MCEGEAVLMRAFLSRTGEREAKSRFYFEDAWCTPLGPGQANEIRNLACQESARGFSPVVRRARLRVLLGESARACVTDPGLGTGCKETPVCAHEGIEIEAQQPTEFWV